MIFVDTGAWFSWFVAEDPDHQAALSLLASPARPRLTTDYVIDELLTLLRARGHTGIAYRAGRLLFAGRLCVVEYVTRDDVLAAWSVFDRYRDKAWSFTDCVSYVVMRRLDVRLAASFDEHFRQFGNVTVMP